MKTIVIHGMLVKTDGRADRDYAGIDFAYNVDDGITSDDVEYYIKQFSGRPRPVPVTEEGEKLSFVISTDSERGTEARDRLHGKILNRVSFSKQLEKDLRTLEWKQPKEKRGRG